MYGIMLFVVYCSHIKIRLLSLSEFSDGAPG